MLSAKRQLNSKKSSLEGRENDRRTDFSITRIRRKKPEIVQYELKETLGVGGFGTVRKAVHRLTGETVAVKICTVEEHSHLAEAIIQEVQHQRTLMHENIAQIYEVIQHQGKIYIFMEYCKNGQLFDRINRNGPMGQRQACKVFHQILSALLYLKANNLSHRDIKPENILFDEHWNAKLIDFGFSCNNSHNKGFRNTVCGTPSYTPPEIIKKTAYDPELVDVWSLGVTLYAMLSAHLPFDGEDNDARRKNILGFRFRQLPTFSNKVQKLFASIFVDAKYRPRLNDLKTSEFFLSYDFAASECIDFKLQNPEVESSVMDMIQKTHRIDGNKVIDSVRNCRFDKYHAIYYLTLKNIRSSHQSVSLYKKQKRNSLIKLQPISQTPTLTRAKGDEDQYQSIFMLKTGGLKSKELSRIKPRLTIDHNKKIRLRDLPDSPRRLLDCLAAYKHL